MRRRLLITLTLLVAVPMAGLAWLGLRLAHNEQELIERRFDQLLEARLHDLDAQVQLVLARLSEQLLSLTELDSYDAATLRGLVRTTPQIDQVFVQAAAGHLLHPPIAEGISEAERAFLQRTRHIFEDRLLWSSAPADLPLTAAVQTMQIEQQLAAPLPQQAQQTQQQQRAGPPAAVQQGVFLPGNGWFAWYWDTGLHLIFWRRDGRGNIIGAELNRARLLADIINELSSLDAAGSTAAAPGPIVLVDARDRAVYQWGTASETQQPPRLELPLSAPLGAWRLRHYHTEAGTTQGAATVLAGLAGLMVVATSLIGLSVYFYRESMRDIREAMQRVRFVNQVSHELRTPLTNIRLYAELLQQRLDDAEPKVTEHLGIIVSESHRLSRLIGNVLAFARHRRGQLKLHPTVSVMDDKVVEVIEHFRPALQAKGVVIEARLAASRPFSFDPDAVEQVLANLLNNVEKYASGGGTVTVTTGQDKESCTVRVADRGPGIPVEQADAVFRPFIRLSNSLTEGVSGTGMGLAISRDMARLHGGDLRLVASSDEQGACFELVLPLTDERGA